MARKISDKALELIKRFEGFRSKAYQDSVGVWTIGYGSTKCVRKGDSITEPEALERMRQEIDEEYAPGVEALVKPSLSQNKFDALVSFAYNLGVANLKKSTLLRLLNAGKPLEASNEFMRWTKAGGRVLKGLIRRRDAERRLFLGED